MLDLDLIPLPSLRPNGRLDRLNYGGGSNKQKVERWTGNMKAYKKETGMNPTQGGAAGYGKFYKWQQENGGSAAPQSAKPQQATVGNASTVSAPRPAPAATGTTQAAPKKPKRTLLSGQQSLSQPYGNETILGAA